MSFSDERKKYFKLGDAAGFSLIEKEFFAALEKAPINEDHAVEILVDRIRSMLCNFRFKKPLNDAFDIANNHALNCIELGYYPSHTKYLHWINDCLKCTDCILFIYMRDIVKQEISGGPEGPRERDIYNSYEQREEADLKKVGANYHRAYTLRNRFTHYKIITVDRRQKIRSMSKKEKIIRYDKFRDFIEKSLDIMVPRYRKAFPQHCTAKGK